MKIAYEPHPVTPERKKELREQGFKILDARFAPKDYQPQPEAKGIPSKTDIARMPKAELVEWIEAHGVENPEGTVADLREKLTRMIYTDL